MDKLENLIKISFEDEKLMGVIRGIFRLGRLDEEDITYIRELYGLRSQSEYYR